MVLIAKERRVNVFFGYREGQESRLTPLNAVYLSHTTATKQTLNPWPVEDRQFPHPPGICSLCEGRKGNMVTAYCQLNEPRTSINPVYKVCEEAKTPQTNAKVHMSQTLHKPEQRSDWKGAGSQIQGTVQHILWGDGLILEQNLCLLAAEQSCRQDRRC
jgi:hypothetical protein